MNIISVKRISLILIISMVVFASCGRVGKDEFKVSGKMTNGENKELYFMEMTTGGFRPIDTISLDNKGEFSFKEKLSAPSIYVLMASDNDYITLIPSGGENIKIKATFNSISSSYSVEGSKDCQLLYQLNQEYINTNAMLASLQQTLHDNMYQQNIEQIKSTLFDKYNVLELHQKAYMKDFLNKNKGSLTCIIALYRTFDNHYLFSLKSDLDIYKSVYAELAKRYPQNQHTIGLKTLIERAEADNAKETENNKSLASEK